MLDSPTDQPVTSCITASDSPIPSDQSPEDQGIINVSSLPTDPSVLARELSTGTTGVPSLDQITIPGGGNAGFERAADLLVGPTTGATPAFTSALFRALALIPDIKALGQATTHSGASGLGFSGDSTTGQSIIVVDPSTGALLEVRNLASKFVLQGVGPSYLAPPPTPSIGTEGGSDSVVIRWLDPVGSPTVVDSLPPGMSMSEPVPVAAAIQAASNLDATYAQLQTLETQMGKRFGPSISSGYDAPSAVQQANGTPATTLPGGKVVNMERPSSTSWARLPRCTST